MQSQQDNCINCKRYFELGQTLPPEGIHIEYKKYYLPIKDYQPKWILLKTIVAFLNSKGGTIFMGVDDSTREVVGLPAQLKQQDMFMLDFAQLLEQIQPEIDLRRKEEVKVRFVPVLKDKTFQGKYVIKIIVKQGDPSKVYHFAQTLKFFCQDKKHHDEEFKVLWGFYRSNMGKVDSIKGTQLLREVYEKAKNPSIVAETYHPGCNPQPLQVSVRNMNIGFKNLKDPKLRQTILDFINYKFKSINLVTNFSVQESKEDDAFVLRFKSITDYKEADACIAQHEKEISSMIQGKDSLIDQGYIDNTHFYKIGQAFNPSLRYLRNRSRSRNKSIDIIEKKNNNKLVKNDSKNSLPPKPNQTTNKTNFKSKEQKQNQKVAQNKQQYIKPKNQFVKNLPKEQEGEPDEDEDYQEQEQDEESPEKTQTSPIKQYRPKPEQFPQLQKKVISPQVKKESNKNRQNLNVLPPKPNSNKNIQQQSPVKQAVAKKQQANEKLSYNVSITNIFVNSYSKFIHYLQNSLGNKLHKIPHKIQQHENNTETTIHFHSLKDIQAFIYQLSKNAHHKKVFHGFGDGKPVVIKVHKGQRLEDFQWPEQNQTLKQQNEKKQEKSQSKNKYVQLKPQNENSQNSKKQGPSIEKSVEKEKQKSHQKSKPKYTPKNIETQSSSPNGKITSPAESFNQKKKQKQAAQVKGKGFLFMITNVKTDLSELQKTQLAALLREILKHYCSQNAKVQILNEKSLKGIVGLNFQNAKERENFSVQMQIKISKTPEFINFFKDYRAFWGVPTGSIIIHHYKNEDRKIFKQEIDELFKGDERCQLVDSQYVKQENKYFLKTTFHPNNFVEAFERVSENISKSPIKDYASSKDGIVMVAELERI